MKAKPTFLLEPVTPDTGAFILSGPVAHIRRTEDGKVVGTIHRSFRNAPGVVPGLPTWWFCPDLPATPVERFAPLDEQQIAETTETQEPLLAI